MKFGRCLLVLCGALAANAAAPAVPAAPPRALTRAERIAAQTAIERVYYGHRIWPKENPGPKPPFEQLVPAAVIEKKADEPLRMSAALKEFWNLEITPAMLQGELDRMERESKDRATLHELFAALHNDPYLIAETLARANLAEQAIRNRYAWDGRFHAETRRRAEAVAAKIRDGADWKGLEGAYSNSRMEKEGSEKAGLRLIFEHHASPIPEETALSAVNGRPAGNTPEQFQEDEMGFQFWRIVSENGRGVETESLYIAKQSFDDWWDTAKAESARDSNNPDETRLPYGMPRSSLIASGACDSWLPANRLSNPTPERRDGNTAVWTGSEMIIWGGGGGGGASNSGGRYNPATDSWRPTSQGANVPASRRGHTAIWTGSEMIVWGGDIAGATGGRYDPSNDSWTPTSLTGNTPATRSGHTAVWTGSEMIVWGGAQGWVYFNSGGRYNPSTGGWIPTSMGANVPYYRGSHAAIWTGQEMIIWGGYIWPCSTCVDAYFNDGGRYNPSSDSWLPTSLGNSLPRARSRPTAVWTGTEMIVWGGFAPGSLDLNTGGRYNPATDSWLPTSTNAGTLQGRYQHTAVWTGSEMVVWGGGSYLNSGARYNPASDSWVVTSQGANVPSGRSSHTAVWTGSEMIVWGGGFNSGGRYSPASDSWLPTSLGEPAPRDRYYHTAVWTGSEMIVWGGYNGNYLNGSRYNPATDSWLPTSLGANAPEARYMHSGVWTGREMIVWGGYGGNSYPYTFKNGGRYNPAADTWLPTSLAASVPDARYGHTAVWSGKEMIVWGGDYGYNSYLNSGGRYNPATDSWLPMSLGVNAPGARDGHTAVWTGGEMIVWGGKYYSCSTYCGYLYLQDGGRYDPVSDAWRATSTGANVPAPREAHTAIWTGLEMIVWGGGGPGYSNTGGRYNPATDSWWPTSMGTTTARYAHTAIWSGTEMIVWGGRAGDSGTNTGGRYNPVNDSWQPTAVDGSVPAPRGYHSAVWTGNTMIVWGGAGQTYLGSGGIYSTGLPPSPGNSLLAGKSNFPIVNLYWNPVSNATSYNVRRCAAGCIPSAVVATPSTNTYSEALNNSSYFYAVEAVNQCGATP